MHARQGNRRETNEPPRDKDTKKRKQTIHRLQIGTDERSATTVCHDYGTCRGSSFIIYLTLPYLKAQDDSVIFPQTTMSPGGNMGALTNLTLPKGGTLRASGFTCWSGSVLGVQGRASHTDVLWLAGIVVSGSLFGTRYT